MTPLRQRMLEDMGIRNFAENTQQSYLQQVSLFARHFARSPDTLGPEQVRTYQVHLVEDRKLAPQQHQHRRLGAALLVQGDAATTVGRG